MRSRFGPYVLRLIDSVKYSFFDGITGWTGLLKCCLSLRRVTDLSLYLKLPFTEIENLDLFRGTRGGHAGGVIDELSLTRKNNPRHELHHDDDRTSFDAAKAGLQSRLSCYPVKIPPFAQGYTSPYLRMRVLMLLGWSREGGEKGCMGKGRMVNKVTEISM